MKRNCFVLVLVLLFSLVIAVPAFCGTLALDVSQIAPSNTTFPSSGGTGAISVNPVTSGYSVSSGSSWITITAGTTGTANVRNTILFTVASNIGTAPRTGTINIGTFTVSIIQRSKAQIAAFSNGQWEIPCNGSYVNIAFGQAGDLPFTGDFNGDGIIDIGVFRPSSTQSPSFYIHYMPADCTTAKNPVSTDLAITMGMAGDSFIVGDWTGNGIAKTGLSRVNGAVLAFFVDLVGDGIWRGNVDGFTPTFGVAATDLGIAGDWSGTGIAKIGTYRVGGSPLFIFDWDGNYIWDTGDKYYAWGGSTSCPFIGDWNGSGTSKGAVFTSDTHTIYEDYNGDQSYDNFFPETYAGYFQLAY